MITKEIIKNDPEIALLLQDELNRQRDGLEMIASENFVPESILEAQGSVLTNKYAEGYPGRRYYGGCEVVDKIENIAIERVKKLFGAEYANVQPHSGSTANAAAFASVLEPGDTLMGLEVAHGGHLSHGMRLSFSGRYYNAVSYGVNKDTYLIEVEEVRRVALKYKPKLIIAGWSAYPRKLNWQDYREIADEVGAVLLVDMAHFAGLVVAGLHPNPVPVADIVTSTIHKTLCGPRSGLILAKKEFGKKIDSRVFPGEQGGPLEHIIAAKAICFKRAFSDEYKEKIRQTVRGVKIICNRLSKDDIKNAGISVLTGGSDVHLFLLDLRKYSLNGKEVSDLFTEAGITINKNSIPFDPLPPTKASGVRIGTAALATRGFKDADFENIANILAILFLEKKATDKIKQQVKVLSNKFPLYPNLNYTKSNS
jgi:glycine hydroxymethyltransferase